MTAGYRVPYAFIGSATLQDGVYYHLYLTESIVLRIDEPQAICTISVTSSSLSAATTSTPNPTTSTPNPSSNPS